jgi:hypothetical protein
MAMQPPTAAQLKYLERLGYSGTLPANRLVAHNTIDDLLRKCREEQLAAVRITPEAPGLSPRR